MEDTIEYLITKLDTQSDKAAEKIITKIVNIGKSTVPALIKAAKNREAPRIRKWALQALGTIGDKRGALLLIQALDEAQMTVKLHSLKGLSRMKYTKGSKKIAELLKDKSGGIRVNALYTLMEINDSSVLPQIQKCLSDPMWYVRQNACIACGKFQSKKAVSKLKKLSKEDERKAVREAAQLALTQINNPITKNKIL